LKPLSFIIITYNRATDILELLQNIVKLEGAHDLLQEIIIVNNASPTSYETVEQFMKDYSKFPFLYFRTEKNLGVSGGRNFAIQKSSAPILVFLDDDALFRNNDALLQIQKIFTEHDAGESRVGIAAFRVYYYDTLELQQNAFPHKHFTIRKNLSRFDTAYFSGCAHAILKTVFETVGYYPEDFFYGMEEYDLSYRTLDAGYKIVYDSSVSILHKESPLGRISGKEKLLSMWVNKSKTAWKYLPKIYFVSTSLLWSLEFLRKTNFAIRGWYKGWKKITKIPSLEKRTPVNKACLSYLQKVKARLWY
jgi:GT2 family glycosyltransferase